MELNMKTIPLDRIIKDRKKEVITAVRHLHKNNKKEIVERHTSKILKRKNDRCFELKELINDFAKELIDEVNTYHAFSLDVVISQDPKRFGIEVLKKGGTDEKAAQQ
jgi:hypothetical protein